MIRDPLRSAARRAAPRWLVAVLALIFVPRAHAQDTARAPAPAADAAPDAKIHVVKPGDTLWEIARIYLTDPFLWPEVYRVNTALVDDPHWIYPGEKLRIPTPGELGGLAAAPPKSGTPAGELPQVAAQAAAGPEPEILPTFENTGPTVFAATPRNRATTGARRGIYSNDRPMPAVRPGEAIAAPYVERSGGPRRAGSIVASSEIAGIGQASDREKAQLNERVYVRLPDAVGAEVGARFLSYAVGPDIEGQGTVVIPTGLLVVERVGDASRGEASTMRVTEQFGEVMVGNGVLPFVAPEIPVDVHPSPVTDGAGDVHVTWIQGAPVVPSLQSYVVLDARERDAVKLGDQFALFRPTMTADDGTRLPEQRIAVAQVVRVTPYGVSAIVIDQVQPAIHPGTTARLSARMP